MADGSDLGRQLPTFPSRWRAQLMRQMFSEQPCLPSASPPLKIHDAPPGGELRSRSAGARAVNSDILPLAHAVVRSEATGHRMKKSLHVVLSCTNRKRVSLASYPRLREVTGDAEERVERWTALIDSTVLATTTADLYLGEFWRLGLSLARSASAAFDTQLWVLSAGLGLINGDDGACAYGATFSSGHPDSVVGADRIGRSTETRRACWSALSAWSGAGRAGRPSR